MAKAATEAIIMRENMLTAITVDLCLSSNAANSEWSLYAISLLSNIEANRSDLTSLNIAMNMVAGLTCKHRQ